MALNDVALASRALIRIGAAPITTFTDGTAEAEVANALFGPIRDALLSSYSWSFATGQISLTQLETRRLPISALRTNYPMIICAHCPRGPVRAAVASNTVLPATHCIQMPAR